MSIEDTLYSTLATDSDVSSQVGDGGSPEIFQIFKGSPPQGFPTKKPYITLYVITGQRISTFSGLGGEINKRIQIDCFGDTWSQVRTLADDVYDAINGNMSIGDNPNEQYFFENETKLHRIMIDISLWV